MTVFGDRVFTEVIKTKPGRSVIGKGFGTPALTFKKQRETTDSGPTRTAATCRLGGQQKEPARVPASEGQIRRETAPPQRPGAGGRGGWQFNG